MCTFAYWWGQHDVGSIRGVAYNQTTPPQIAGDRPVAVVTAPDGEQVWRRWSAADRTATTERAMIAVLEGMARDRPETAMAIARREPNLILQEQLRNAVLRGWATKAPEQAAAWAMTLSPMDRPNAITAVFQGAVERPNEAVRIGTELCAQNPAQSGVFGQILISSLAEAGAFETAVRFAAADASENRASWINTAFYQWATYQPIRALASLDSLSDPIVHAAAFQGLVTGWAMTSPDALAAYAVHLPPGELRSQVLSQALPQWAIRNPADALAWIDRQGSSPEFDPGVISIATLPLLIADHPETAVSCAADISDPVVRASILRTLGESWAERDPLGANRYMASAHDLSPDDRKAIWEGISPSPR
jgi:hypothetical protein